MKMNIKKIILAGIATLLLGACTNANDEKAVEETAAAKTESTYDEVRENWSYFVEDIKTTFNPVTTELPTLSPDEEALAEEVSLKLNDASTPKPGEDHEPLSDRGYIETFADDYLEYTVDELTNLHYTLGDINLYGRFGDQYISNDEMSRLHVEALRGNLKDPRLVDAWRLDSGEQRWNDDLTQSTSVEAYRYNGDVFEVKIVFEFNDDYSEATLVELVVDGEKAELN